MLASQNGIEGYIRYNAANAQVGVSWNKIRWLTANLTVAGNIIWKHPDAFSATDNVLKNAYCSLSLDLMPIKALRLYADAAGTTYEITHDQYSTNLFLNAGAKYDFSKTLSVTLTAINLLNRESYEITSLSDIRHGRLRRHLSEMFDVCFFSSVTRYLQNSSRIQKISIKFVSVMGMDVFM